MHLLLETQRILKPFIEFPHNDVTPATARSSSLFISHPHLWYVYFRLRPIRRLSGTDKEVAISNSLNAFVSPSHLRGVVLARSIHAATPQLPIEPIAFPVLIRLSPSPRTVAPL